MKFKKILKDISWNELAEMVGSQIYQRGENYFKSGRVKNLSLFPDGLVADVQGTDEYFSLVDFKNAPEAITFECTCPYRSSCKHSVAVILAYIETIKKKAKVPAVPYTDYRIKRIKEGSMEIDLEVQFDGGETNKDIKKYLNNFSKQALIETITQYSTDYD